MKFDYMFLLPVFLALVAAQMEEKTNVTFVEGAIYKTKLKTRLGAAAEAGGRLSNVVRINTGNIINFTTMGFVVLI